MSKPVTRVAFLALIVLVLVAGIYFTVQAASSRASLSGERAITTAGLLPDTSHVRSSFSRLEQLEFQSDFYQDSGHGGCERNGDSPDD
jgi:hypothetical protein